VQSSSHIIITNKPTHNFLQAGCPSCHPTNSVKALNIPWTCSSRAHLRFSNLAFIWPLKAPDYLGKVYQASRQPSARTPHIVRRTEYRISWLSVLKTAKPVQPLTVWTLRVNLPIWRICVTQRERAGTSAAVEYQLCRGRLRWPSTHWRSR